MKSVNSLVSINEVESIDISENTLLHKLFYDSKKKGTPPKSFSEVSITCR